MNRCGYNLADVLGDGFARPGPAVGGLGGHAGPDHRGHAGHQPLPRHRGVALLLFESLEKAARAVPDILPSSPTACDLMDRRHLSLARESEVRFDLLIPAETEAVLLVEYEGDDPLEVRDRLHRLVDELWQQKRLAFGAGRPSTRTKRSCSGSLVDKAQPLLYRREGAQPAGAGGRRHGRPAGSAARRSWCACRTC